LIERPQHRRSSLN